MMENQRTFSRYKEQPAAAEKTGSAVKTPLEKDTEQLFDEVCDPERLEQLFDEVCGAHRERADTQGE